MIWEGRVEQNVRGTVREGVKVYRKTKKAGEEWRASFSHSHMRMSLIVQDINNDKMY